MKSLERLQCDYVDLVFCHRPDPLTPVSTVGKFFDLALCRLHKAEDIVNVVRAMTDLIR